MTNSVCCSSHPSRDNAHKAETFGSTVALDWINGNQILARGSLGDCHVYDIRRMGGNSEQSRGNCRSIYEAEPSLIWELTVPPCCQDVRSKIALYCNGIATTQSAVVAPLLNQYEDPCFGFWSLKTGQWIGLKELPLQPSTNSPNDANAKPPPFLELCRSTTPAFTTDESRASIPDPLGKNRCGLWFKSGKPLLPPDGLNNYPLKHGNIYHMSISG